ncbi:hypothetical protein WSM22_35260 [Cytophagales bacterium WSM2-2]|nr:hypothetical protein WSM22_35260 [Cytophagales bacterium WSM2-2]
MKFSLIGIVYLLLLPIEIHAQDDAVVIVVTDADAKVSIDGIEKGKTTAGSAFRISASKGEHYVEAQSTDGIIKGEIVQLETGKQKILKIVFEESVAVSLDPIAIASLDIELAGGLSDPKSNNFKHGPQKEFFYAFEAGDEIIINITMANKNGSNQLIVSTYPDGVERYSNTSFADLSNLHIKVSDRSIYRFSLSTNYVFSRKMTLSISRKPLNTETVNFNSKVALKKILTPVSVAAPMDYFINGPTDTTGLVRLMIPLTLPENTIEWYYRFTASKNQEDIQSFMKSYNLLSEIISRMNVRGSNTAFSFESLLAPPGKDLCDVLFLPYEQGPLFESLTDDQVQPIPDVSRNGTVSGNVKVMCCNSGSYYLGVKNLSAKNGIHVSVEVVAMTGADAWVMETR